MIKMSVQIFTIFFYAMLLMASISANEFEEDYNTGVDAPLYIDFDNDGKFDFDLEDDEESLDISYKFPISYFQLQQLVFVEKFLQLIPQSFYQDLASQVDPNQIFTPPRA